MKKIGLILISLILMVSCSSQNQFNVFKNPSEVSGISVTIYIPINQSYVPDPISVVDKASEVSTLVRIINRSVLSDKVIETGTTMGGPGTFDYQLLFSGSSSSLSMIYIKIEADKCYLSALTLFDQTKNEYKLYQVQSSDLETLLKVLKISQ